MTPPQRQRLALLPPATLTATATLAPTGVKASRFREILATLVVTAADAGGTYDVYVTSGDGTAIWDIIHFPQIAGTAKTYAMKVYGDHQQPGTVASNGALTSEGAIDVGAGGANTVGTLAAGSIRNGQFGHMIGYKVVAAGTVTAGITCSVTLDMRA